MIKVKNHSLPFFLRQVEAVDLDTIRPCHHMLGPKLLSHTSFIQSDMNVLGSLDSTF